MTAGPARRASLALAFSFLLVSLGGCKALRSKKNAAPAPYKPAPRHAYGTSAYASLCETNDRPFDGAKEYKKGDQPSRVAIFYRYLDDPKSSFRESSPEVLRPLLLGPKESADEVELVACVDMKREGDPGHCSYYDKELLLYTMKHTVRVIETKTGKEVAKDEFTLDHKTARCPGSYSFPSGSSKIFEGGDYGPRLGATLLPLEPDGTALSAVKATKLDDVCSGSAVPQAAAYTRGAPAKIHLVYFPDEPQSFAREDLPTGMPPLDPLENDASEYKLVACITGKPQKKKRDCTFTSGKTLLVHDGEFEVRLHEAKTGKLVETKSFKGTSPSGCPLTHKFWGSNDKVMTKVEPGLAKWIATLEGPKS